MKMRALNHVNLVASDPEASAVFYESVFGMERSWKEGEFVFLTCGDTDLALARGEPNAHRRFHIGFRVDSREEVEAWHSKIVEANIEVSHGPADYDDYLTFTCRDPDGYGIEIYYESGARGRAGDIGTA